MTKVRAFPKPPRNKEHIAHNRRHRNKPKTPICGCGRDYMTVNLEESHTCPQPN